MWVWWSYGRREENTIRLAHQQPNPLTSFARVMGREGERFSLHDISGRKVGTCRGDRVGEGLAPGVYSLRSSESNSKPLRIVKVR